MAQVIKKLTVCDVGMEACDNTTLHKGRLTLDGKTKAVMLCSKHAEPVYRLMGGAKKAQGRAKIYDPAELRKAAKGR